MTHGRLMVVRLQYQHIIYIMDLWSIGDQLKIVASNIIVGRRIATHTLWDEGFRGLSSLILENKCTISEQLKFKTL